MEIVTCKNNIPIRLTEQRWFNIIENHDDLAAYSDEVLRTVEQAVVYKEFENDGFVIIAHFTGKIRLEREAMLWPKKPQEKKH